MAGLEWLGEEQGEAMPLMRFMRDQNGGVLVEATILIPILFVFLLGAVDYLFNFYESNLAAKAVERGARIAAVSNPVATNLDLLSSAVVAGTVNLGDPWPAASTFAVTCDGSTSSCTCAGTCTGFVAGYDQNAMNRIVCGRDNTSSAECDYSTQCAQTDYYFRGMCDIFSRIRAANVRVVYTQSGLGYAGRPMPVPTITVSLQNLPRQYFFLSGLLGLTGNFTPQTTTTTGEVLSSAAQ
jgi:Flp pilus assembly protein TadG